MGTILVIFDLQVTPVLPTKFQVNWPFSSGEEAKNRVSRWWPWWPIWISGWNNFSYFLSTSHPDASYQVKSQLVFWFRRRSEKIDFQDCRHVGFLIRTILAIFFYLCHPDASNQASSQMAFQFRRRSQKWIFKMAAVLDFRSEQF